MARGGPRRASCFPDIGVKMIFASNAHRRRHRAVAAVKAILAGSVALVLLAGCGGGTSQQSVFVPSRLLVFGDDSSAIAQDGVKYNVNGLDTNNAIDCSLEPLWVQIVASSYGLKFAECNPQAAAVTAIMRAQPGAKVADVQAQVVAQIAAGGFRANDMATMLAGANDVLELYAEFPGRSLDDLSAAAGARGAQLAQAVNLLVHQGVKVLISDLPDLGYSPFAIAQKTLDPNVDRAAVLSKLTSAFNQQLGVNLILDGHNVGLVQAQLRIQEIAQLPGAYGFTNVTDGLCTVAVPECTTSTLVSGAVASGFLWTDDTHFSPGFAAQIASLAIARVSGNPF
jgi:outer membrane lipase/esterase